VRHKAQGTGAKVDEHRLPLANALASIKGDCSAKRASAQDTQVTKNLGTNLRLDGAAQRGLRLVDTHTHQSDLGPKSTRAGADGTQAHAQLSRSKRP
jgi:hypothetical protein